MKFQDSFQALDAPNIEQHCRFSLAAIIPESGVIRGTSLARARHRHLGTSPLLRRLVHLTTEELFSVQSNNQNASD